MASWTYETTIWAEDQAERIEFSHENEWLSVACESYRDESEVWSVGDWSWTAEFEDAINLDFSPADDYVAYLRRDDGDIDIYTIGDWNHVTEITTNNAPDRTSFLPIKFSNDGDHLASSSYNGISIYRTADWSEEAIAHGDTGEDVWWSPNDKYLAVADGSSTVTVYETDNWTTATTLSTQYSCAAVAWAPNDEWLAAGSGSDTYVFDTTDPDPSNWSTLTTLSGSGFTRDNHFSRDSAWYAHVNSGQECITIYDTSDWSEDAILNNATDTVFSVRFSPWGWVAYGDDDRKIYIHHSPVEKGLFIEPQAAELTMRHPRPRSLVSGVATATIPPASLSATSPHPTVAPGPVEIATDAAALETSAVAPQFGLLIRPPTADLAVSSETQGMGVDPGLVTLNTPAATLSTDVFEPTVRRPPIELVFGMVGSGPGNITLIDTFADRFDRPAQRILARVARETDNVVATSDWESEAIRIRKHEGQSDEFRQHDLEDED